MELMLAAADAVAQGPSALQTYGPWGAVAVALGGPKGIAMIISLAQGKGVSGGGKYNKELCEQRHKEIKDQRDTDRADIVYIRTKMDELFTHLLGKKD